MALVEAVRRANPAAIHLGASVTQITETEDGVVVGLVDGRSVAGSLLVGADGVHSVTRSALIRRGEEILREASGMVHVRTRQAPQR